MTALERLRVRVFADALKAGCRIDGLGPAGASEQKEQRR